MTSAASTTGHRLLPPRSGREKVLVLLTLAALPFFFLGSGSSWLASDLGRAFANLGHIPFFALVTALIGSRFSLAAPGRWLAVSAVILALSIAIEFFQSQVGRSASWHDVLRNLTGSWLAIFWLQPGRPSVWCGRVTATSLLAMELFLFTSLAVSQQRLADQLPTLANFETPAEIERWQPLNSALAQSNGISSEGRFALQIDLSTAAYSGASLTKLPQDWSDYRRLNFDLYNPHADGLQMTLRIHDLRHEFGENKWQYNDRFNQRLDVQPGWNHYGVLLESIEGAPEMRRMDLSRIETLQLFATSLAEPKVVHADNFRLEQ